MADFFGACLMFPTALYSVLLAVVVVYWLFVIIGALDIDMLDFDGDGVMDALTPTGGGLDSAVEASAGAKDAAAEAALGAGGGGGGAALASFLGAFKLRRAPATVVGSFMVLFSWTTSLVAMDLLDGSPGGWLLGLGVAVGALLVSLPLTSLTIRPLARFFATHSARGRKEIVGHLCTVTTGRVDGRFGQATCRVGSDELLVPVRCDRPNRLTRGSEALVISFDAERDAFVVEGLGPS